MVAVSLSIRSQGPVDVSPAICGRRLCQDGHHPDLAAVSRGPEEPPPPLQPAPPSAARAPCNRFTEQACLGADYIRGHSARSLIGIYPT